MPTPEELLDEYIAHERSKIEPVPLESLTVDELKAQLGLLNKGLDTLEKCEVLPGMPPELRDKLFEACRGVFLHRDKVKKAIRGKK